MPRAIQITAFGGPEQLQLVDLPVGEPGPGEIRIRHQACGLNFTDTPPRGMPLRVKVTAVLLYLSGLSMNRTAKLLGVSTPSVMAWIEQFAEAFAQKPEPEGRAVVVELDEMWHFLKKTRTAKLAGC